MAFAGGYDCASKLTVLEWVHMVLDHFTCSCLAKYGNAAIAMMPNPESHEEEFLTWFRHNWDVLYARAIIPTANVQNIFPRKVPKLHSVKFSNAWRYVGFTERFYNCMVVECDEYIDANIFAGNKLGCTLYTSGIDPGFIEDMPIQVVKFNIAVASGFVVI